MLTSGRGDLGSHLQPLWTYLSLPMSCSCEASILWAHAEKGPRMPDGFWGHGALFCSATHSWILLVDISQKANREHTSHATRACGHTWGSHWFSHKAQSAWYLNPLMRHPEAGAHPHTTACEGGLVIQPLSPRVSVCSLGPERLRWVPAPQSHTSVTTDTTRCGQ